MAPKLYCARWMVIQSNVLISICGFVLLALSIWTIDDKLFLDELLRNKLYLNTTYIILISSCIIILLSFFGCFAAVKEVKFLLLTYFIFMLLLFVILSVGGILAYIFREQVSNTIQAEMIHDIRNYDPTDPHNPVTKAWDETQMKLSCCGLMTEQVSSAWEMWRYNKILNPSSKYSIVPSSCCLPQEECVQKNSTLTEKVHQGDCMVLALEYVVAHFSTIGGAALTVSCFLMLGMMSSMSMFRSIV